MTPNSTSAAENMLASTGRRMDVSESFICGPKISRIQCRREEGPGCQETVNLRPASLYYDDLVPPITTMRPLCFTWSLAPWRCSAKRPDPGVASYRWHVGQNVVARRSTVWVVTSFLPHVTQASPPRPYTFSSNWNRPGSPTPVR